MVARRAWTDRTEGGKILTENSGIYERRGGVVEPTHDVGIIYIRFQIYALSHAAPWEKG